MIVIGNSPVLLCWWKTPVSHCQNAIAWVPNFQKALFPNAANVGCRLQQSVSISAIIISSPVGVRPWYFINFSHYVRSNQAAQEKCTCLPYPTLDSIDASPEALLRWRFCCAMRPCQEKILKGFTVFNTEKCAETAQQCLWLREICYRAHFLYLNQGYSIINSTGPDFKPRKCRWGQTFSAAYIRKTFFSFL